MAKKKRRRDLITLWQGKVARAIARLSDKDVSMLSRLVWHKGMSSEQKYLVFDRAIFDVWSEREAVREQVVRARRVR
jgi:hypothetical protein